MKPDVYGASTDLGVTSEIPTHARELPQLEVHSKVCQQCGKPLSWFVCGGFNYCCDCDSSPDNGK